MKKILLHFSICSLFVVSVDILNAQSVSINTNGDPPDASALLDVKSTTKGLLIPRMTTQQRTTIPTPAQGLIVFDNQTTSFWFYKGAVWTELAAGGSTTNYWSPSGANIFNNNSGNVGIGINTPLSALHIKRDNEAVRLEGTVPYIGFYNNDGVYKGFLWQGPANNMSLGTSSNNASGRIEFYNNGTLNTYIANTGSMEISGTFPRVTFNQNGITSGDFRAIGNDIQIAARKLQTGSPGNIILQLNESSQFGNFLAGNVGIGTANPTHKLSVNGNIRSKEVVVETGWADYVFDQKYKLPSLVEVETFIKQNKHLHNIPSSKEIEEKGLHVGEVQKRMMEKIEELTLYIIELDKKIKKLELIGEKSNS